MHHRRTWRLYRSYNTLSDRTDSCQSPEWFPIKTLLINILGAFVIGLVVAFGAKKEWNPQLILFLKVGICGGFTTFSSFALETNQLIERGAPWSAALYVILSVVGGLAAVYAGLGLIGK